DAVPGAYLAVAIGGGVLEAIWRQPIAPGASCRDFFMVFRAWLIGHVPELREASGLVARGPTRAVLDAAPACLWTTRPDGACDFVNRTWLELTGTTFESQLGDGWVSSVHPEDRERTQIAYLRAVRARVPFRVEIRVRRADGSHGWLIAAGAPIFGGDGEFAGFIGSALDVDAWRQAARVSRRFFDLSPDILCVVGLDGRLRGVNTAFERTLGYAQDRLVGLGVHELLHPDDVPGALEILRHLAAAEQVSNFEVRMRARDGAFRWLQWNAVAVAEDAAIYAAARDVTERRDAVVALEHARAAAETATRTKSEFLARVSHEIRTPMNGVIGMTGLLLDTTLTGPQREYAETIRKSASALLTLINDILDFSKIEAGRLTIEPVPFDLALTLDEVTDLLAPRAIERGVEFIVHLAPDTPRHLIGDAGRIRQVLLNLADNALKFTEAGHVFINVSAVELGERPVRVRFAVHDTGIGIPSEVQAQLFEPFFQADTGLSRRHGGTGLGLAICRQLVHLMGGTIAVESSCGQGSTFTFTLPMEVDSTPRLESRQPSELAGLRALVVDDHRINRWMLREQLLALGMAPTICGGGEVALELMRRAAESEQPFRVALIDEEMPGMDGAELARTIGEEPAFAGTMLVMLVGHGRPPRRASADVIAYLSKPVRLVALRETLTSLRLEHADAPSPESARPSLHRRFRGRVLVVEDNAINQRVASLMLERLGCRVDVAADGREALDMVGQIPYDLIFMDCQMPEMDGFEATRAIRRGEAERRLPIAAMTAHALPDDRRRCIDAGMDEYLSKPVQLGELLRVV
ncbi:MAG TPA: response regulator, partial [Nannocystaceae bacterium]|nr:response regulator [Nannocystaceae bacterium]